MYPCPNCQKPTISPASKLWVGKPIIDGIVPERTTTCSNCSAEISVAGKNLLWLWYRNQSLSLYKIVLKS